MITLNYPTQNKRWPDNELNFESWEEYWKTLGYLSNPNVHRYNNPSANIKIVYENNDRTHSYSGAYRIEYFGNVDNLRTQFPALYSVAIPRDNMYRINRNEFGDTLVQDLRFSIEQIGGRNTDIVLPPTNIELVLRRLRRYNTFDENAWNEGYNLGNI